MGCGKAYDVALVTKWLANKVAALRTASPEPLSAIYINPKPQPSVGHSGSGVDTYSKDGLHPHLELLHWTLESGNRFFSSVYRSGTWIPAATATDALQNGFNLLERCLHIRADEPPT